jgi:hypothetical protein
VAGLLQVTGAGDEPPASLRIRYKLFRDAAPASDREKLKASLDAAAHSLSRIRKLRDQDPATQPEYDRAVSDYLILRAKLDGDQTKVARMELERARRSFNIVQKASDTGTGSKAELDEAKATLDQALLSARDAGVEAPNDSPWSWAADTIYAARVKDTRIVVYLAKAPFDPTKHWVVPGRVEGRKGNGRAFWPEVDGHRVKGFSETDTSKLKNYAHVAWLAVLFVDENNNEKLVPAPPELISHIFHPSEKTAFDMEHRRGVISVSSDGQAVAVDLGLGDGAASGHAEFTFTAAGDCTLGTATPHKIP